MRAQLSLMWSRRKVRVEVSKRRHVLCYMQWLYSESYLVELSTLRFTVAENRRDIRLLSSFAPYNVDLLRLSTFLVQCMVVLAFLSSTAMSQRKRQQQISASVRQSNTTQVELQGLFINPMYVTA